MKTFLVILLFAFFVNCDDDSSNGGIWDMIVIGQGFGGLTACAEASSRGLKTLCLEARGKSGVEFYFKIINL